MGLFEAKTLIKLLELLAVLGQTAICLGGADWMPAGVLRAPGRLAAELHDDVAACRWSARRGGFP
jgi:hypothetical protein